MYLSACSRQSVRRALSEKTRRRSLEEKKAYTSSIQRRSVAKCAAPRVLREPK